MNGWGFLLLLDSFAAIFSIPVVLYCLLMRAANRMSSRTLVKVIAADTIIWLVAFYFWSIIE